jgi:uncharacterized OB-fold protein
MTEIAGTTMSSVRRPRPRPTEVTRPFWEATAQGRFLIQRCDACKTAQFYPKVSCTTCGSQQLSWEDASGRGTVFTFSIARRPTHPAFNEAGEYVVAIVELAEGPHVTTNIVGCDPEEVEVGLPVEVVFDTVGEDGIAVPVFRLVPGS